MSIQVSNLIILNEAGVQDHHAFPDLVSSAEHIFQTVRTLTHTGYKLAQESFDEVNCTTYNFSSEKPEQRLKKIIFL